VSTITIGRPSAEDTIVRLVNNCGADELNVDGKSFRRDHRGAFHVPRKYVTKEPVTIAGFVEQPITLAEGLQDVAGAIAALPPGRVHDRLSAALADLCEAVDTPDA
jgi:hypothetical protein